VREQRRGHDDQLLSFGVGPVAEPGDHGIAEGRLAARADELQRLEGGALEYHGSENEVGRILSL